MATHHPTNSKCNGKEITNYSYFFAYLKGKIQNKNAPLIQHGLKIFVTSIPEKVIQALGIVLCNSILKYTLSI